VVVLARIGLAVFALVCAASGARAYELDSLLPDDVPGYGAPFAVTGGGNRTMGAMGRGLGPAGWQLGGVTVSPGLDLSAGYDSAPNGAAGGSALLRAAPDVAVADEAVGFGGFVGADASAEPDVRGQNTTGLTAALGESAVLPGETVTVSAAWAEAQETGFDLITAALPKPSAFTVADLRASDRLSLGLFEVTPEISVTRDRFSAFGAEDRTVTGEAVTAAYGDGGPGRLVVLARATQSAYAVAAFGADTYQALAGVADDAPALWHVRLLAGLADREPATGRRLTTPVLEAGLDWQPDDLYRVRLKLAREVDNPEEITAAPTTLTLASLSLSDEAMRDVTIIASAQVENAAFLGSALRETLTGIDTTMSWQMTPALSFHADLSWNNRQANQLRAADEAVVTGGVTWTP
jgi:hypothetical protein